MTVLHLGRLDPWDGVRAVVLGFGAAGFAAADNLTHLGATVLALDAADPDPDTRERAELLEVLGATVRLGVPPSLPGELDLLVVASDRPVDPVLLAAARESGVPVWSDLELAWRVRHPDHATPWLVVAGGRAGEVVPVLHGILEAAGQRVGLVGDPAPGVRMPGARMPVVEAVMDPTPYDVLVVAVAPAQLLHTSSVSPLAAAVLLDGSPDSSDAADEVLAGAYHLAQVACVYDLADPRAEHLVREADVVEGARAVAVTLGMPGLGMLGLVEDLLVDRSFIEERASSAAELATVADVTGAGEPDPAVVTAALVAAALARAHGVDRSAVRAGLRATTRGG